MLPKNHIPLRRDSKPRPTGAAEPTKRAGLTGPRQVLPSDYLSRHHLCWEPAVRTLCCLASFCIIGCASARAPQPAAPRYEFAAASILAVDSPVAAPYPLPGLDREPRERSAYFGYDTGSTESYWIISIDQQSTDPFCTEDSYQRIAVTERSGVRSR